MIHQELKLIIRGLYSRAAYINNAGKKRIYHIHTNVKIFFIFFQLLTTYKTNPRLNKKFKKKFTYNLSLSSKKYAITLFTFIS